MPHLQAGQEKLQYAQGRSSQIPHTTWLPCRKFLPRMGPFEGLCGLLRAVRPEVAPAAAEVAPAAAEGRAAGRRMLLRNQRTFKLRRATSTRRPSQGPGAHGLQDPLDLRSCRHSGNLPTQEVQGFEAHNGYPGSRGLRHLASGSRMFPTA